MSYDIERFEAQPERTFDPRIFGRVGAQVQRREETRHHADLQRVRRLTEVHIAEQAGALFESLARMDGFGRTTTEAKFRLSRARKESRIIADEDLELTAKFAALDDDLFQKLRLEIGRDQRR